MSLTFDEIGDTTSLSLVAEQWRDGSPGPRAGGTDDAEAFQADLHRILFCFNELRRETSAKNVNAFSESMEHQLAAKSTVLGNAISDVASVESNLDRLLAARGELAVDLLEAIQMVRLSAALSLS
jgi:hypothetical protein